MDKIGIIGAGAWGTALALTACRAGRQVTVWAHDPDHAEQLARTHRNDAYLPDVVLPADSVITSDLAKLGDCEAILLVTPAQYLREVLLKAKTLWPVGIPLVICSKGIEQGSGALLSDIVAEILPDHPIAVLSGPTFATEVAQAKPAAITLACADSVLGHTLVNALGTPFFRPYLSNDLIGAQIGGAVKNVLAIACGIVWGRDLGDNARAALLTRGIAEIMRMARAKGGLAETLMGLSGIGDLLLTASSHQSRNFSLGVALGQGQSLASILAGRKAVTEGVFTARSVMVLAQNLGVEMPICAAVDAVLHHGADVDEVIAGLLSRPFTTEF